MQNKGLIELIRAYRQRASKRMPSSDLLALKDMIGDYPVNSLIDGNPLIDRDDLTQEYWVGVTMALDETVNEDGVVIRAGVRIKTSAQQATALSYLRRYGYLYAKRRRKSMFGSSLMGVCKECGVKYSFSASKDRSNRCKCGGEISVAHNHFNHSEHDDSDVVTSEVFVQKDFTERVDENMRLSMIEERVGKFREWLVERERKKRAIGIMPNTAKCTKLSVLDAVVEMSSDSMINMRSVVDVEVVNPDGKVTVKKKVHRDNYIRTIADKFGVRSSSITQKLKKLKSLYAEFSNGNDKAVV